MANRRMFSMQIVDSDAFLDMPVSSQALYFHLGMRADDEGFLNNAKKICRMIGAAEDDLKLLITKKFLIPFEDGVVVIKHWKINNYIQKDRFRDTVYQDEKARLTVNSNGGYSLDTGCIQTVHKLDAQSSLGQDSLGKERIVKNSLDQSREHTTIVGLLSDEDFDKLDNRYEDILKLIDYIDDRVKDFSTIKDGYKYAVAVAENANWMRKIPW